MAKAVSCTIASGPEFLLHFKNRFHCWIIHLFDSSGIKLQPIHFLVFIHIPCSLKIESRVWRMGLTTTKHAKLPSKHKYHKYFIYAFCSRLYLFTCCVQIQMPFRRVHMLSLFIFSFRFRFLFTFNNSQSVFECWALDNRRMVQSLVGSWLPFLFFFRVVQLNATNNAAWVSFWFFYCIRMTSITVRILWKVSANMAIISMIIVALEI